MKKLNSKGFTLIELLAVIVIMGILMVVAIPAVSRTIENSRKDTFISTGKNYTNQVKTLWAADGLKCRVSELSSNTEWVISSAVPAGASESAPTYYAVPFNSKANWLLEQGGKSSWGNQDVVGYVVIEVYKNASGETKQNYKMYITDGNHAIWGVTTDGVARSNITTNVTVANANFGTDASGKPTINIYYENSGEQTSSVEYTAANENVRYVKVLSNPGAASPSYIKAKYCKEN